MKKILSLLSLVAVAFTFASCGDDNDYTPGKEVSDSCPTVYFSSTNESEVLVSADMEKSTTLKLERKVTEGELVVPVVVDTKTGSLNVPESVTFADGASEAELTITYDEFETGMKVSLHIPEEYTDPYTMLSGSLNFTLSFVEVTKVCDVAYQSGSRFASVKSAIYVYGGQNKFLWKDFLGSGKDMLFTVDTSNTAGAKFDANDLSTLKGDFTPLSNCTYNSAGGWYFTDGSDNTNYMEWTPAGQTEAVTSYFFWGYYNGGNYSYIEFDPGDDGYGYGYFYSAWVNDTAYETTYYYLNY